MSIRQHDIAQQLGLSVVPFPWRYGMIHKYLRQLGTKCVHTATKLGYRIDRRQHHG
jgi:hypothetical protein